MVLDLIGSAARGFLGAEKPVSSATATTATKPETWYRFYLILGTEIHEGLFLHFLSPLSIPSLVTGALEWAVAMQFTAPTRCSFG